MNAVEIVGYVASALVVASLAMRSVVKLRTVSLIGSLAFVVYGVLIGSLPVLLTNSAIAVINVFYLSRERRATQSMSAVPIEWDAPFLKDFLGAHALDIQHSQPDYHPSPSDRFIRLLTRDGFPAGVLVGEPSGNELFIRLDYVTPTYRDSQIAKWLFGPGRRTFTDAGITRLVAQAHTSVHRHYLEFVGFHREGDDYALDLAQ